MVLLIKWANHGRRKCDGAKASSDGSVALSILGGVELGCGWQYTCHALENLWTWDGVCINENMLWYMNEFKLDVFINNIVDMNVSKEHGGP